MAVVGVVGSSAGGKFVPLLSGVVSLPGTEGPFCGFCPSSSAVNIVSLLYNLFCFKILVLFL